MISTLIRTFSPGEASHAPEDPSLVTQVVPARRRVFRPALGWLETRTLLSGNPTYYTVNLTSDTGASSGTDAITGDASGDLLWAITQANANTNTAGSVVNFDPTVFGTPQTVTLTSTLVLSESDGAEVIQGPGSGVLTISGGNAVSVFLVDGGVTACLSGLTISAASGGNGGGIDNNGSLTISGSSISDDMATGSGGGLYNVGTATVTGCTFAADSAGANSFNGGGGINNSGTLVVSASSFTGNTAIGGGGISNSGTITLSGSSFSNNQVSSSGGGFLNVSGQGSITDCTFTGNAATGSGGGLLNYAGSLAISGSTFSGNTAEYGAGLANGATLTLSTSTLTGNSGFFGAGILNNGGSLTVVDSTLSANSAPCCGNALGGGIDQAGGTLYVINSTVAENSSGEGGGIYDSAPGLTVINSTIAYNQNNGIYNAGGSPILDNTIVAWNTAGGRPLSAPEQDTAGTPFASTSAYNLVGVDTTGSFTNGVNGNLVGVTNAGLGPLGYNGGPTQTIAAHARQPGHWRRQRHPGGGP